MCHWHSQDKSYVSTVLSAEDIARRIDCLYPTADTCFFNVTLPAYSSVSVMREKLLAIVTMDAWGLDGDDVEFDADGIAHARQSS